MKKRTRILPLAGVLLLCAAGGLLLWRGGFFSLRSVGEMRDFIARFAPYSHLAFFLLQLLSVILAPIPSNISAAAGGLLFGTWPAFLLTFTAVASGSMLVFSLARALGRGFADRLVSRRLSQKYQDLLHRKASMFLFLAFLFPFFPDDVLCILAGLTDLSHRRFLVILLLTRPWGLLVASALGGATLALPPWAMVLIGLAGLAVFLLGMKWSERIEDAILRRLTRKRK